MHMPRAIRWWGRSLPLLPLLLMAGHVAARVKHSSTRRACGAHDWRVNGNEHFNHTPYDTNVCCTPNGTRCKWHGSIPDCERFNLISILKWFKHAVADSGQWALRAWWI